MEPLPDIVKNYVRFAPVCRIATVRTNGEPHVIPVCPAFDGESTVYVDIGRKYTSAEGVGAGGQVTVLIDEYHDDWSQLKGVLLRCRAEVLEGGEKELAWRMIREKFPQYITVKWQPRLTLALRVYDWRQWGIGVSSK
jgi:nitroimidazol reductase NimA-like FMN-containing flavoprotein (pyridoxamine 5'-phosphate oxidase superfamily)